VEGIVVMIRGAGSRGRYKGQRMLTLDGLGGELAPLQIPPLRRAPRNARHAEANYYPTRRHCVLDCIGDRICIYFPPPWLCPRMGAALLKF